MKQLLFSLCMILASISLTAQEYWEYRDAYVTIHSGVNMDYMRPSGYRLDYLNFNTSKQWYLSANVDIEETPWKNFIVRMGVSCRPTHFRAQSYTDNAGRIDIYELKQNITSVEGAMLYRIPWRWKLQPYFGAGISGLFNNVHKNELKGVYTDGRPDFQFRDFDLNTADWVATLQIGFMWRLRYDFTCKYWNTSLQGTNDPEGMFKYRSITLALGYRF
jgi:hypothetical protein